MLMFRTVDFIVEKVAPLVLFLRFMRKLCGYAISVVITDHCFESLSTGVYNCQAIQRYEILMLDNHFLCS